jgi:hypothetical protein
VYDVVMMLLWVAMGSGVILVLLVTAQLAGCLAPDSDPNWFHRVERLEPPRRWVYRWLLRPALLAALAILVVQQALPRRP